MSNIGFLRDRDIQSQIDGTNVPAKVNPILNHIVLRIDDLRVTNIVLNSAANRPALITVINGTNKTVTLYRQEKGSIEILEETKPIGKIKGVPLWQKTYSGVDGEPLKKILLKLGFHVVKHNEFELGTNRIVVVVYDYFIGYDYAEVAIKESGDLILRLKFWHLHELQNIVYEATGHSIVNAQNFESILQSF